MDAIPSLDYRNRSSSLLGLTGFPARSVRRAPAGSACLPRFGVTSFST